MLLTNAIIKFFDLEMTTLKRWSKLEDICIMKLVPSSDDCLTVTLKFEGELDVGLLFDNLSSFLYLEGFVKTIFTKYPYHNNREYTFDVYVKIF